MERKFKKEIGDMAVKLVENTDLLMSLKKNVQSLMGKDNTLEDLCLSLLEIARIDVQLMEAEEEDKKSISLLGLREDLNPNAPTNGSSAGMSPSRYPAMASD
jgi:cell shape-determining protein MreC